MPALSGKKLREAQSTKGLNLLIWESFALPMFARRPDVSHLMVNAYVALHRGFRLKEMISSQVESCERLERLTDSGGWVWEPKRNRYVKPVEENVENFIRQPHIVGVTRELVDRRPASWVGTLFDYQPARFRFTVSEQRLLRAALASHDGTDQGLAESLRVSLPTVKKTWLSIYERVGQCEPDLIPGCGQIGSGTSQRGKGKRRRLLAYLREHTEELRPIARR